MSLETKLGAEIHAFNTGRGYTSMGQRIAWTWAKEPYSDDLGISYRVCFYDVDRGIYGTLLLLGKEPDRDGLMAAYMHCNYYGWIVDFEVREALRAAAEAVQGVRS